MEIPSNSYVEAVISNAFEDVYTVESVSDPIEIEDNQTVIQMEPLFLSNSRCVFYLQPCPDRGGVCPKRATLTVCTLEQQETCMSRAIPWTIHQAFVDRDKPSNRDVVYVGYWGNNGPQVRAIENEELRKIGTGPYAWGHFGVLVHETAASILKDCFGEEAVSDDMVQQFKMDVLGRTNRGYFVLRYADIMRWYEKAVSGG